MTRVALAASLMTAIACTASPAPRSSAPDGRREALAEADAPSVRLQRGLDNRPPLTEIGRNPFRFEASPRTAVSLAGPALPPLPPADGLPMLPLPLAQPPLRLLGLVRMKDGTTVAVITVGAELTIARTGDLLAGRFRVGAIGDDGVDMMDVVGDRVVRLALP